ncbi:MAG: endopeptidase La [Lachnospiraceae bacterium]|nr:endopeptidase La [Lachnospiraceae bacterium]
MLVIPVYDTMILSGIQINVQEDIFSENELKNVKAEEVFLIAPIKEQKERRSLVKEDFFGIGILAKLTSVFDQDENTLLGLSTGKRVRMEEIWVSTDRVDADYVELEDIMDVTEDEEEAYLREFKGYAGELVKSLPAGMLMRGYIRRWKNLEEAATNIGGYLDLDAKERYEVMAANSKKKRFDLIMEGIKRLVGSQAARDEIRQKMSAEEENNYKAMALRKQMKVMERELSRIEDGVESEEAMFSQRIEEAGMPEEVEKEAKRVLKRFAMEGGHGSEYGTLYEYLDFLTSLSWKDEDEKEIDIVKAKEILEKDHYGLDKVKKRILEQIAVMSLKKKQTGSILLFVGAPGTGKTSMGQSVANALGRKFVRISLGGVRDEAEIRGHRRTYVGAMPGRIMEGIKRAGSKNPVVVLDEIDKLASEYKGDPASALLEVLDPEQNHTYVDHYMNVPYDLSKVFFLCTANSTDGIPAPLLDRMEVISLSGYTPLEKLEIAKRHLLPQAIEDNGLKKSQISISQGAMKKIISDYTREAGVRGLKKQLDKVCRDAAVKILEEETKRRLAESLAEEDTTGKDGSKVSRISSESGSEEKTAAYVSVKNGKIKISVKEKDLFDILGKKIASHETAGKRLNPGVATGLAWTQVGGEILYIETVKTKGSGKLHITGQLGDVMKESAEIAYSLVKSKLAEKGIDFDKTDIHIHVPEGAVPKDGPSAGVTLYTALTSLFLEKPVKNKLAMTGEVSLRGEVLPIGGLPEKLMAAERAGMETILIPDKNEEDLREIPEEITKKLTIIPVHTIEEVRKESLGG